MDNPNSQQVAPQPQAVDPSAVRRSNIFPITLGGLLLLGMGLVVGYFIAESSNQTTLQITQISPTQTLSPSVSKTANWSTVNVGKLQNSAFSSYSISYPGNWNSNLENDHASETLTLTKDNYIISSYQAGFGGGGCVFEGEVPQGPYSDLRAKKYIDIFSPIGTFRRYEIKSSPEKANKTTFAFCFKEDKAKDFRNPTVIGSLNYEVPLNYDEKILQEMDTIIQTVKEGK